MNNHNSRNIQMPKYNFRSIKDLTVQYERENPKDTLQCIKWANLNSNNAISEVFCCGGWDGYFRMYQVKRELGNEMMQGNRSISNQVKIFLINFRFWLKTVTKLSKFRVFFLISQFLLLNGIQVVK